MSQEKEQKSHYMRFYTLRDNRIISVKVKPGQTFKKEMLSLGLTPNDIIQIQLKPIEEDSAR
ncbi:hypothetical protein KFD70_06825 [Bacillus pfraonensis]|uniref:hypothetical protein n=1 Tax=Bacillus TaxID=1386 RepID=UPI003012C46F